MSLLQLRRKAMTLGIEQYETLDRVRLIRAVQIREGHAPCYNTEYCDGCIRHACPWRFECTAEVIPCAHCKNTPLTGTHS